MPEGNCTALTEFILLGFTDRPEVEIPLFGLFLLIYGTTLVGNVCLVVLVRLNAHLHTPMYYFLSNLSFLDLSCSSAIAPKMLVNLLSQHKAISSLGCGMQMFLLAASIDAECLVLAAMAYDRYVAVCHPLLYPVAMSHGTCTSLVAGAFLSGALTSLVHTSLTFSLRFCGSGRIDHFFCDIPALLELPRSDTRLNRALLVTLCGLIQTSTFLSIALSYTCILSTLSRIQVTDSRHKAFHTCSSHLTAVGLFYGSLLFTYLKPSSNHSPLGTDKAVSALYTLVFPMLNPLIYSLRNKEVKDALRRTLERRVFSQGFLRVRFQGETQ
ncbi:olfactory receptor 5AS1-like [Myiozetetes cayanensis]|uniref:olfactory receptor 5AS1-like n=1 Tax=Myiozetetes cayanensis TaxID=478635 RepID=UPI00215ED4E2|nr:olfactory receptor 5AS1-like [Myiozetetes cayanensis]